jgi:hypothetical protein
VKDVVHVRWREPFNLSLARYLTEHLSFVNPLTLILVTKKHDYNQQSKCHHVWNEHTFMCAQIDSSAIVEVAEVWSKIRAQKLRSLLGRRHFVLINFL